MVRSPLRSPASTCASGTPRRQPLARRRASSSCLRRRATRSGDSPAIAPRSPAASRDVGGVQIEPVAGSASPSCRRRPGTARGTSAARCAARPPRSRVAERSGQRRRLDELRTVSDDGQDFHRASRLLARRSEPVVLWGWGFGESSGGRAAGRPRRGALLRPRPERARPGRSGRTAGSRRLRTHVGCRRYVNFACPSRFVKARANRSGRQVAGGCAREAKRRPADEVPAAVLHGHRHAESLAPTSSSSCRS